MRVHTLQPGDEVLLDGGIRLTVLAVEGNTVWLGVTAPQDVRVVAEQAAGGPAVFRAALTTLPSRN